MPILTPEERLGSLVGEKYRLESILGQGGMGVVYAATHAWTNRPVALKLLLTALGPDPEMASRFLEEARAAARLDHPNVVDVLDMGRDPDGSVYMVLERLEGETLHSMMQREIPMSPQVLLDLVLPVMDALGEAHDAGIIHRDIKPANIFLAQTRNGLVPKLLDFGIAKVHGAAHKTTTGIFGTPQYMSPEQARESHNVGPAADVWAMGVVLYYGLSARLPFEGQSSGEIISRILTERPDPLEVVAPDLPPALCHVIDVALREEPEDRHIDMATFAEMLRAAASATGTVVTARVHGHGFKSLEESPPAPIVHSPRAPEEGAASTKAPVPVEDSPSGGGTSLGPTTPFATSTPRPRSPEQRGKAPLALIVVVGVPLLAGLGLGLYPMLTPNHDEMQLTPLPPAATSPAPEIADAPDETEPDEAEAAETGVLTVTSDRPCELEIDGEEVDEANGLALSPGTYVLACENDSARRHAQVEIVAGEETVHAFAFEGPQGRRRGRRPRMRRRASPTETVSASMEEAPSGEPDLAISREYD